MSHLWKLVPVEPTREMLDAFEGTLITEGAKGPGADKKAYAAMLAVAPKPAHAERSSEAKFTELKAGDLDDEIADIMQDAADYDTQWKDYAKAARKWLVEYFEETP